MNKENFLNNISEHAKSVTEALDGSSVVTLKEGVIHVKDEAVVLNLGVSLAEAEQVRDFVNALYAEPEPENKDGKAANKSSSGK